MKHVILRQAIEIQTDNSIDVFVLQQRLSDLYHDEIVPMLSNVFDTCSDDEAILYIDQMIIDLGVITEGELDRPESIESLMFAVNKQVTEQLRHGVWRKTSAGGVISATMHAFDHWLFYMEYGYMKWNVVITDESWHYKVLEAASGQQQSIDALRVLIRTNQRAVRRIVFQHKPEFLTHILEALTAQNQGMISALIEDLSIICSVLINQREPDKMPAKELHSLAIWEVILLMTAANPSPGWTTEHIILNYIQRTFKLDQLTRIILLLSDPVHRQIVSNARTIFDLVVTIRNATRSSDSHEALHRTANVHKESGSREEAATEGYQQDDSARPSLQRGVAMHEVIESIPGIGDAEPEKALHEDGLFVRHAGLVVLHPFLNSFFKEVKLVEGGQFINTFSIQKAMLFLQYLATGDDTFPEFEMIVAKVLCNFPLKDPFDTTVSLTDEDKTAAAELLKDVIAQWEILKNSTASGLREGFLQRMGKYYVQHGRHYLHVENSSIDMLLDRLPWALGPIKLPWMKHMLNVAWR